MATATTTDQRHGAGGRANGSEGRAGDSAFTPPGRRVQRRELAIGLLVVLLFGLGGVLWHLRSVDRVAALAIASAVDRGEVVESSDLRRVHISGGNGLARLAPLDADRVVGRTALVDLDAGMLVTEDLVADAGGGIGPEDGVVGLALEPGQYPAMDLAPGDLVDIVVGPGGSTALSTESVVTQAVVFGVRDLAGAERKLVSLRVSRPGADTVAALDPATLRLVLVPS